MLRLIRRLAQWLLKRTAPAPRRTAPPPPPRDLPPPPQRRIPLEALQAARAARAEPVGPEVQPEPVPSRQAPPRRSTAVSCVTLSPEAAAIRRQLRRDEAAKRRQSSR